jgi:alkylation response protein AidB-like acyl-CoA dehydrogenase
MANLVADERDIKFTLFELFEVQKLCTHDRYAAWNKKVLSMLVTEARKFSEKELYPLNIEGDKIGIRFEDGKVYSVPGTKKAYEKFVDGGWLTPTEDESVGGQGLPYVIKVATWEMFSAANFPFICYANLTHGAAKLIELYGTDEQKKRYMEKMYGGQWLGTMALTEPNAGSDVGAVQVAAKRNADGTYSISGQKIFITNGDSDVGENVVNMVLARIEGAPPGVKGLSVFIVPNIRVNSDDTLGEPNDVRILGVEHKMGLNASATTTMSFGEKGNCTGYLLGNERDGIKIMFHMMNAARLETGVWGQGSCSIAYLHALNYARERKQGTSIENPDPTTQVPIIQHPDIRRMLLLMKSYVEGMRAMIYYCGYAMDQAEVAAGDLEKRKWQGIVDLMIPICKAYPTERAVEMTSHAVQIYGGSGYTKEYPVEQFMRDCKVACIFEGTTGIQAMDLAFRKLRMEKGDVFKDFFSKMDATVQSAAEIRGLAQCAAQLQKTKRALMAVPAAFTDQTQKIGHFFTYLKATPFLEAVGDVTVAWFLLWSAVVAEKKLNSLFSKKKIESKERQIAFARKNAEAAFLDGKIKSAKFFIGSILPITEGKIAAVTGDDVSAWEIEEKSFGA